MLGLAVLVGCGRSGDDSATQIDDSTVETPPWSSIHGTVEYEVVADGVIRCDATIAFTGVPYAGFCPTCEFAFEVEATVTRDDGSQACFYSPLFSLYENSAMFTSPTAIGFAPTYEYFGSTLQNVLLVGFTYLYEDGEVAGPYAEYPELFYDGSYYGGHASFDGKALAWGLEMGAGTAHYSHLEGWRYDYYPGFCSFDYVSEATAPYDAGHTVYGSLPCTRNAIDVFMFDGESGGTAGITLDVTGGNPDLDPMMWVYGPDSCVERLGDANFACTVGGNLCPAMSLPTEAAEYLLVVMNSDRCKDDPGSPSEYRLDVASSWDPVVTPLVDDESNVGPGTIRVEGTATLVK